MMKDLSKMVLKRAEAKPSDYVGTEVEYVPFGEIRGQITPTTDAYSIANYGERVTRMYSVITSLDEPILVGDRLVINGEDCTVVSILKYSSHQTAVAERTGKR